MYDFEYFVITQIVFQTYNSQKNAGRFSENYLKNAPHLLS